ncbi:PREDICTED: putative ATP-dependent RNA helicase TDRD12 isoform X2 [Atta colombica]|uniref:putative ATP-dependent RNA helicase TDRD12 isoform X2 n=1 Tax=Atta colombica TaxID=520822 RepID=UPI00084C94B0|nr:PREDICTED: putative ATP-dependent RNA helicase TDRD12 isoform X2 [Atta colombica]
MKFHKHQVLDIPATAKAIKIRNVKNPYCMRAYEVEKHAETLCKIEKRLLNFMKTNEFLKRESNAEDAQIGDMVLIQDSFKAEIELSSCVCRGLITCIKKEYEMYYIILLVDHGISIELTRDKFHILPKNLIPDKYLTKTVGVYDIIPICMRKSTILNGCNTIAVVAEKWTEKAIQFTKHLLSACKMIYFDHLITNKSNGIEYGEFYFVIDKIVMSLSEALFLNYYAVYIEGELLKLVETHSQLKEKRWYILYVKFSRNKEKRYNVTRIKGTNNIHTNFFLSEKILVQSSIDCDILSDITDLRYPKGIHEGWDENIKSSRPRKLQSYIWPAINNGLNVVAIGSTQCGKTSGCVMAVCGQIALRLHEIRTGTQPLALILCASSYEAMIYNGCQILVTTPRYLVRFLNKNKGILSFDRLSCLILDNVDVILDKYYNSVGELFKKHKIIENREPQQNDRPILQIIISATHWTPEIKKFVHLVMYNPYICIASFIEAMVFKSVKSLKLYHVNTGYKNQKLFDLMSKNEYLMMRTAIICTNAEEAENLNTFLILTKKTLLIHDKMKSSAIRTLRENWMACICGSYPVLICTDPVLSDLNFTNIQWLIHFSVLSKLKNQFNYRFSLLLDNLTEDSSNCKISIIVDENDTIQLLSIVKIMQRMNIVIRPKIFDYIQRKALELERNKKVYALCDNVKSFGFCQTRNVCVFRHCVLSEIDAPITNIQIGDKVKLIVTYIHDTTHFSARILEHIPRSNESEKITFSNIEYMQNTSKIQSYYGNIENRKMSTSTNIGDICVLEETIDTFKRIQITRIRYDRDYAEDEIFVDVRCIDSGIVHEYINVCKLMHIPKELLDLPTHVVEIFLANLIPWDEEYMWNHYTNEQVHKWFSENFDERSYIIGEVRLHLGNTIWLDDLKIGTKLIGHPDLIGSSLKKELCHGNFSIVNNNHLSNLFKLCRNSGMTEINGHNLNATDK